MYDSSVWEQEGARGRSGWVVCKSNCKKSCELRSKVLVCYGAFHAGGNKTTAKSGNKTATSSSVLQTTPPDDYTKELLAEVIADKQAQDEDGPLENAKAAPEEAQRPGCHCPGFADAEEVAATEVDAEEDKLDASSVSEILAEHNLVKWTCFCTKVAQPCASDKAGNHTPPAGIPPKGNQTPAAGNQTPPVGKNSSLAQSESSSEIARHATAGDTRSPGAGVACDCPSQVFRNAAASSKCSPKPTTSTSTKNEEELDKSNVFVRPVVGGLRRTFLSSYSKMGRRNGSVGRGGTKWPEGGRGRKIHRDHGGHSWSGGGARGLILVCRTYTFAWS